MKLSSPKCVKVVVSVVLVVSLGANILLGVGFYQKTQALAEKEASLVSTIETLSRAIEYYDEYATDLERVLESLVRDRGVLRREPVLWQ